MIANGRQTVADICLQLGGGLEALPGLLAANGFASLTEIPAAGTVVNPPAAITADAAQVVRLLSGITIATWETSSTYTPPAIGTAAIGSTFIIA